MFNNLVLADEINLLDRFTTYEEERLHWVPLAERDLRMMKTL